MKKSNKRSLEYRKIILYSQLRECDKNSCGNLNLQSPYTVPDIFVIIQEESTQDVHRKHLGKEKLICIITALHCLTSTRLQRQNLHTYLQSDFQYAIQESYPTEHLSSTPQSIIYGSSGVHVLEKKKSISLKLCKYTTNVGSSGRWENQGMRRNPYFWSFYICIRTPLSSHRAPDQALVGIREF